MIDLRLSKASFAEPYSLRERISIRFDLARYDLWRLRTEGIPQFIAYRVPRKVAYWAFIRVFSSAWADAENKTPDELTYDEVAKAWECKT